MQVTDVGTAWRTLIPSPGKSEGRRFDSAPALHLSIMYSKALGLRLGHRRPAHARWHRFHNALGSSLLRFSKLRVIVNIGVVSVDGFEVVEP